MTSALEEVQEFQERMGKNGSCLAHRRSAARVGPAAVAVLPVLLTFVVLVSQVGATPKGQLTQAECMQASWDWVQDTTSAATKWGSIGDWDVSGVQDMSYAFSRHRSEAGGAWVEYGNPKAASFTGAGLVKWTTGSVRHVLQSW